MAEEVIHKYEFALLRNFGVEGLTKYLKKQIPDFSKAFKLQTKAKSHDKICNILNEKLKLGMDDSSIEGMLFQILVYMQPDKSYYFTLKTNLKINDAMQHLCKKYSRIVDRKITESTKDEGSLVSIRREQERLVLLFKEGIARLGVEEERCNFYVTCIIDFDKKNIEIKLSEHKRRNAGIKLKNVLNKVEKFLKDNLTFSTGTESFYLNPQRDGEARIHKSLYQLFAKETARSLELIKEKIAELEGEQDAELAEEELKKNVRKYLEEELRLRDSEPYVNKVLSSKYQDTVTMMSEAEFVNDGGFVFGFTFVDRRITKSSNKNEQNKPVYYSKIYWDLKETVKDYEEICDLGVFWKFNSVDFTKSVRETKDSEELSFAEIGLKEIHNVLEIHYYFNKDEDKDFLNCLMERRAREKYVIRKIRDVI
ncbi:hypothetical protein HFP66_01380 [Bacillus sp. A17A.1]|uniref:hypothetical protein n=1 Tax=Bacillus cereus TaxID=1396 RepID=UPI001909426E|nr:hypothetical protein [Bacillus cereus]MBK4744683.1 hypothetical protein [Bacillus cereus]